MGEKKVDVTLTLVVEGEETVTNTLEYKGTSIKTAVAVENGLADLVKALNQ
jgi:hypothetical protein